MVAADSSCRAPTPSGFDFLDVTEPVSSARAASACPTRGLLVKARTNPARTASRRTTWQVVGTRGGPRATKRG